MRRDVSYLFENLESIEDYQKLQVIVSKFQSNILNPSPLHRKGNTPEERREIQAGRCSLYTGLSLSAEQVKGILQLSDELLLSEYDCLRFWIMVSKADIRRWLESELGLQPCSLDHRLLVAAREAIVFEYHCLLDTVNLLLKFRLYSSIPDTLRDGLMAATNQLLRKGIVSNLIDSILTALQEYQQHHQQGSICKSKSFRISLIEATVQKLSSAVFFALYHTQISQEEERKLSNLVSTLSSLLADGSQQSSGASELLPSLIVLQLASVCGLSQTSQLFDRLNDTFPYTTNTVMNSLAPSEAGSLHVGSDAVLRYLNLDRPWAYRPAEGFACLVYAVLLQPAVDEGTVPPSAVQACLTNAHQTRAYSFITSVMLPLLRTAYTGSDILPCLVESICELVSNLLTVFCLDVYPRLPFPLSQQESDQDSQWLTSQLAALSAPGTPKVSDSIDDVIELICELCAGCPLFCEQYLWQGDAYHPFLAKASDAIRDPIVSFKLLTAMASAPEARTAMRTFVFVDKHFAGRRDWKFLLAYIADITVQLGGAAVEMPDDAVSRVGGRLSDKDAAALLALMQLMSAVCRSTEVCQALHVTGLRGSGHAHSGAESLPDRLFAVLACPVPAAVKGEVYRALVSWVSSTGDANRVWGLLEQYRMLPLSGARGPAAGGSGGIRYELEVIETAAGVFPATDGFLSLLETLLSRGVPEDLGIGYRRPGVLGYLEFALDEVLLRLQFRNFFPAGVLGEGQRWRLASLALQILVAVVRQYRVNALRPDQLSRLSPQELKALQSDFREDVQVYFIRTPRGEEQRQSWPRPKSVGFAVMTWLLAKTRLLDCLLMMLTEATPDLAHQGRERQMAAVRQLLRNRMVGLDMSRAMPIGCDLAHYMELCASLGLGLLQEVIQRESVFVEYVRSADRPLSVLGADDSNPAVTPARVGPVAKVLGAQATVALVSVLTGLMSRPSTTARLPAMAVRVLHLLAASGLAWESLSVVEEQDVVSACVAVLLREDDAAEASADAQTTSTTVVTIWGAQVAPSAIGTSVVTPTASARSTALEMLLALAPPAGLSTPSIGCAAVGLRLIGLQSAFRYASKRALDVEHDDALLRQSCLGAILALLDPRTGLSSDSLIRSDPTQAAAALEVLHAVCASPLTSSQVLDYIRRHHRDFLRAKLVEGHLTARQREDSDYDGCLLSLSWLMRIAAVEVHGLRSSAGFGSGQVQPLLEYLFHGEADTPSVAVQLLTLATSERSDVSAIEDPKLASLMAGCTVGGLVDLSAFREALGRQAPAVDIGSTLLAAESFNQLQIRKDSSCRLCEAWATLVCVCLMDAGETLTEAGGTGGSLVAESLIAPLLELLREGDGLETWLKDSLALVVSQSVLLVRRQCIAVEDEVWRHIPELLRGLAGALTEGCRAGGHTTCKTRGLLATSLTHMLRCCGSREGYRDEQADTRGTLVLTKRLSAPLVAAMAGDIGVGSSVWRLAAMSALTVFLSDTARDDREAFAVAVNILVSGRHLRAAIVAVTDWTAAGGRGALSDELAAGEELALGSLNLCIEVARDSSGATHLLELGMLEILLGMPPAMLPVPVGDQETGLETLVTRLWPVLRLLLAMGQGGGRGELRSVCAVLLRRLRSQLCALLRCSVLSVRGLRVSETVVALLLLLENCNADASSTELFLGPVTRLLEQLGSWSDRSAFRDGGGEWWGQLAPATQAEKDLSARPGDRLREVFGVQHWTAFDDLKLTSALAVAGLIASLLRLKASSALDGPSPTAGTLSPESDIRTVAVALTQFATLLESQSSDESGSETWLMSSSAVTATAQSSSLMADDPIISTVQACTFVCDNLSCAIHDLCILSELPVLEAAASSLETVFRLVEDSAFSPHSFLCVVLRSAEETVRRRLNDRRLNSHFS